MAAQYFFIRKTLSFPTFFRGQGSLGRVERSRKTSSVVGRREDEEVVVVGTNNKVLELVILKDRSLRKHFTQWYNFRQISLDLLQRVNFC